jgi:ABC-type antimicrobial peptide transport system permease subunit
LSDADPRAGLALRQTLASRFEEKTLSARMIASLLFIFAMMSLLIAAIGQYAVVAFSTRRRMRDFGIRLALGATGRQIVSEVLGEGTRLTLIGLLVGFGLSVGLATVLQGALYGVRPTDPRTYASVFVMLAAISLIASYLPARRASRIDPVQALRQE